MRTRIGDAGRIADLAGDGLAFVEREARALRAYGCEPSISAQLRRSTRFSAAGSRVSRASVSASPRAACGARPPVPTAARRPTTTANRRARPLGSSPSAASASSKNRQLGVDGRVARAAAGTQDQCRPGPDARCRRSRGARRGGKRRVAAALVAGVVQRGRERDLKVARHEVIGRRRARARPAHGRSAAPRSRTRARPSARSPARRQYSTALFGSPASAPSVKWYASSSRCCVEAMRVARFERLADLPVHAHAPVRRELLVERGTHERVRERVAADRAGDLADDRVLHGLVERVEQLVAGRAAGGLRSWRGRTGRR